MWAEIAKQLAAFQTKERIMTFGLNGGFVGGSRDLSILTRALPPGVTGAKPAVGSSKIFKEDYGNGVEVYIWNTGTTFVMDNSEVIAWLEEFFGADGLNYVDAAACQMASEESLALDGQISDLVADSGAFVAAEQAIASATTTTPCPWDDGKPICIDGYITDKVTWTGFVGDNRGSDANAPYSASRFQVKWNPDANTATIHVSMSSNLIPAAFASVDINLMSFAFAPPDTADSQAITFVESDSTRVIRVKAYDGYCNSIPHDVLGTTFICPAATFNMRLTLRDGNWIIADSTGDVASKGYPSIDVWKHNSSGGFDLMRHDPQGLSYRLWQREQSIRDTRAKRSMGLPPGCYYQ